MIYKIIIILCINKKMSKVNKTETKSNSKRTTNNINKLQKDEKTKNFIRKARAVQAKKNRNYDYRKTIYVRNREKIIITCPKKGHGDFTQAARSHIYGAGCPKCGREAVGKAASKFHTGKHYPKKTFDEFVTDAIEKHDDKYQYVEETYVDTKVKTDIYCNFHDKIFKQTPNDHLHGYGCPDCGKEKVTKILTRTQEEFEKISNEKHNGIYDYSKTIYVSSFVPVIITCKTHKMDFTQAPAHHISGSTNCFKCVNIRHSKISIEWLEYIANKEGIKIQHAKNDGEFKIPGTNINSNALMKADGYCKKTNTIYEFHGCYWHACPICKINNTDPAKYHKTIVKENLIRSLGFNLVTIWEHNWRRFLKDEPPLLLLDDACELIWNNLDTIKKSQKIIDYLSHNDIYLSAMNEKNKFKKYNRNILRFNELLRDDANRNEFVALIFEIIDTSYTTFD